jgi:DNA-binding NtrC family response regulator
LKDEQKHSQEFSERDILYKVLFEMKKDMDEMKMLINEIMQHGPNDPEWQERKQQIKHELNLSPTTALTHQPESHFTIQSSAPAQPSITVTPIQQHVEVEESLSLTDKEKEFIEKALSKHKGRRKLAAKELGISERTLYRKMNEYGIH